MTNYNKQVPFPRAFVPDVTDKSLRDPFANTMRGMAAMTPLGQRPGGSAGGGGGVPDVSVVNGITGAVIDAGTETLTIAGKSIYWVQIRMNVNGTAGYMLVLGSLGYPTSL